MRNLILGFYSSVFLGVLLVGAILTHMTQVTYSPALLEDYSIQAVTPPRADSLDYHLMMADLAWQRKMWPQAANHYLTLAKQTNRGDFALLATSAALEAQLVTPARQGAELWAMAEPDNYKAKALTASLCIAEFNEPLAYAYLSELFENSSKEVLPHLLLINATLEDPAEQELFLSLLQQLSSTYGYQSSLWFVMARQAQRMQQFEFALVAADHSLALEPDWVSAIALRVQLLYQMGDKTAARDYLADVVERFPDHADLNYIYTQIADEVE